ncbi:MAG: hypothetical protein JWP12_2394 [Bacteroidetes bacterium]|nr:hypothetical protein [Bacteroidota bacterium]
MPRFLVFIVAVRIEFLLWGCGQNIAANGSSAAKKDSVSVLYSEFHDFESVPDAQIDSTKAFSGKRSGALSPKIEYGFGMEKFLGEISSFKSVEEVNVSFKCWMNKKDPDAVFVLSIDNYNSIPNKNIMWEGKPIVTSKLNDWDDVHINFKINKLFIVRDYTIKLYIWNKGKNTFYFDDLLLDFIKTKK